MLSNGLSPLVARKWRLYLHMGITMEQIVRFTCRLLPTLELVMLWRALASLHIFLNQPPPLTPSSQKIGLYSTIFQVWQ